MRFLTTVALGLILAGCAGSATVPAIAPAAPTSQPPSSVGASNPSAAPALPSGPREWPELNQAFEAERVTGTIALFDTQDGVLGCSDLKKCQTAVTPASTFKIPHSIVALETGVVEGPDTILPWSHETYTNENWNQDLSFRDAFRLSCLPCYRAIARKLGDATEQEWLNKLGYGNRSVGDGGRFWLDGALRITALEQIDFLRRFDGDKLPISSRTADLVRDIMTIDVTETYVLRGKTGSSLPPDESVEALWFVGWLEVGERRIFFATLLDSHRDGVDPLRVRRSVTERILKSKGWM